MQNLESLDVEICRLPPARRAAVRRPASTPASLRALRSQAEAIRPIDLSVDGCGFEARWPFAVGSRVLLRLPGLELWTATVAWFEEGRGGLAFDRPLHQAVADRLLA